MTTLDTFARSAASAVHESVAGVTPPIGTAAALGGGAVWMSAKYALAGALAGAAVLAAVIVAPINDDAAVTSTTSATAPSTTLAETPVTTVAPPTTVPGPNQPVVVPPGADTSTTTEADRQPPTLVVTSPSDGEHLEAKLVTFTGTTEPGASVVASGKFDAAVAPDGTWAVDLVLAPGANGVVFTASDAAGNTAEVRLTVHYDFEAPKESTTTTTKAAWKFTANQKYGSCSEPLPYDEFYGAGKPGSTITVTSAHGSGSTTVSGDGSWWIKVEFPSAPFGEVFSVKVKDEFGNKKVFDFVSNHDSG